MFIGVLAAREYAYEENILWKQWIMSLALMVVGIMFIVLTL